MDRSGTAGGAVGPRDATLKNPSVSPDGQRVAVSRTVLGNSDIWLLDGLRDSRFTFDPEGEGYPVWSGDGTRITFSLGGANLELHQKRSNGAGDAERVLASDPGEPKALFSNARGGRWCGPPQARQYDVVPDGRFLINTLAESGPPPITLIQNWNPEAKK